MSGHPKGFRTAEDPDLPLSYQRITELLDAFESLPQAARVPEYFNIFRLLRVPFGEVVHSRVLAWLLEPTAPHQLGTLFLSRFLSLCRLGIPESIQEKCRGYVEHAGEESIVDIMICAPGELILFIENKVFSGEGFQQIDREARDLARLGSRLRVPEERQFAVFLTPGGRKPISGDHGRWISLSYQQVVEGFSDLLPLINAPKVRFLIEDWLDVIGQFGGE